MKGLKVGALAALLAVSWGGFYYISQERATPGAAFEQAIAEELNIPVGSFNQNEVRGITELDLSGYGLTDLTGLEHFQSLEILNLSNNDLTDVSVLSKLQYLETIDLSFNQLTDIPDLAAPLVSLDVEGNDLTDLSFLPESETLTTLNLRDNDIESLEELAIRTPNVTHLNLRGNAVQSVEPLASLPQLTDVNARDNRIDTFAPLAELNITERLYVTGNATHDYAALAPLAEQVADRDFEQLPDRPAFSEPSGVISPGTELALDAAPGASIFYTIDGSEPTETSSRYTGPIALDAALTSVLPVLSNNRTATNLPAPTFERSDVERAIIVRAIAVEDGATSELATRTYLLDDGVFASELPVVSLSTDAKNLFDPSIGIYTPGDLPDGPLQIGQGNFYETGQAWERPAHIDYFEQGNHVFGQDIGIRIHGGFSRGLAQKSLRLYARSEYGQSRFYHSFFPDNEQVEFNRLLLRNAGNDWQGAMLRDAYMQELLADRPLDFQDYQPAVVLMNGEYWGMHNIRELYSAEYFEIKYDIDETELAILEAEPDHPDGMVIETGQERDLIHYREMVRFAKTNDLNDAAAFAELERRMDIDNFLEYAAYQAFYGNLDSMFNNYAVWRKSVDYTEDVPRGHDGRWRWIVFDLDQGFAQRFPIDESVSYDMLAYLTGPGDEHALFRSLIASEEGEQRFIRLFNDLLNGAFTTMNMEGTLDEMAARIEPEMPRTIERWQHIPSMQSWEGRVDKMRQFAERRPDVVREQLRQRFELGADRSLRVESENITINSVEVNRGFVGTYYDGDEVMVSSNVSDGKLFINGEPVNGEQATIRMTEDFVVTFE
ncbi:CotH kinase family protein [Exiguobacterium aurantiacum]|uniref:CotH kinase family protein n=1 Tax=Exiguobacterium aurantiacum TaxID=33987 RepID=UPI003D07B127